MFFVTSPFKSNNLSLFVRNFSCSNSLKKEFLSREIYFDTLARLLTGKETCVAVCYHRSKLYISSNKNKPEHAKEKIKLIRNIIDNKQLSANYEELLKSATRNTLHLEKEKSRFDDDKQEIKSSKNLSNFLEILKTFAGNQNHDWSILQKSIEKLFSEIKLLEAENKAKANREWEYLINFHDSVFLVEAIKGKLIDKEMINLLKDQEKIEYVSIEDKEKSKMDAEMKIVESISKKKKKKMKTKQDCYIGLSKLTCDDCSAVLNIMNQEGFKWKVCGRHGSGDYYSHKWIAPTIMEGREEEIKLWKENNKAKEKIKETTSKIPHEWKFSFEEIIKSKIVQNIDSCLPDNQQQIEELKLRVVELEKELKNYKNFDEERKNYQEIIKILAWNSQKLEQIFLEKLDFNSEKFDDKTLEKLNEKQQIINQLEEKINKLSQQAQIEVLPPSYN